MTNIRSLVDNIVASDNVTAQEKIADIMAEKLQTLLDLAKIEVANEMFNTCEDCNEPVLTQEQYDALSEDEKADYEEIDEALVGGQKKIDANKNGKLDAQDFKMLRAKKGMKEDVTQEAYSDPYAAKKSAEMKKAHAATMADAKKEYDAAKKSKFAKNFMKMKKEEVEQVDEVITKKTPTGEVISDFVHSKNAKFKGKSKKERIRMALGAKYAMMKNEESELQELDKSTMISYLQKRHFQGKKTTPKQEKGRMNALSAIDTKNQGKKRSDKEKAASSMSGAQADYKKGTYSGD
jgi:hypothetical protein